MSLYPADRMMSRPCGSSINYFAETHPNSERSSIILKSLEYKTTLCMCGESWDFRMCGAFRRRGITSVPFRIRALLSAYG
jgi:hypothetical protein